MPSPRQPAPASVAIGKNGLGYRSVSSSSCSTVIEIMPDATALKKTYTRDAAIATAISTYAIV